MLLHSSFGEQRCTTTVTSNTSVFNIADWQLVPEFPPDKEDSSWHYPPEKDGWCTVRRALKSEIKLFAEAFEAIQSRDMGLREWEVSCIQSAFAGHFEHVHWHHQDEDDSFVTFMKTRVKYPEKLEADLPIFGAQCKKVKEMIEALEEGGEVDNIIIEWKKCPHMDEELLSFYSGPTSSQKPLNQ